MPSVPLDMRRIAQAAVDAAFDQLEESKQKSKRKARILPPKRALLAGAALATAGRLAWSSRGQGLLDSVEGRLSGLVGDHGPSEPDVEDVDAPDVEEDFDEPEAEEEPEAYDEEVDEPEDYEGEDEEYDEEPEGEADDPEAEGEEDFDDDDEEDYVDDEDSEPEDDSAKRPKARSRSKRRN